ncbi:MULTISPECIES: SdiA-regulated domain-containing protein [Pseudomonadaceae]|uniref:SdiA-regulated domain-containing protein n=1 Tax=Ectopseudomonas hydrolytica TaxID=2493633 RepID=A0ABY5A890_9GAMM|nr:MULTISPECIES: SdiA-regulated domain-containing protein [Pseudomonas]MBF8162035.1 SdiA-regulated domain-containing protein [Pseudomonas mendocina]MDH0099194.1 SdiA-regulated domain-containing protein [Pseudomonas sp. GD04158]USR39471.1 SdiA-regulated domain-containing protein [Pseudomonas hydrolytica]UTH31335.1 SdiA-regulated domain-containing protein [Pseudomonas hydrolytica]UZZ10536.1 SdiA-regulated domain-containing protein [Pseudomonas mendocina]
MSLPRFRLLRPRYWLSGIAVLALGVVVQTQHLDDRALLWWQEGNTPLVNRLASVWLPGYRAVIQARALPGLEKDETSGLTYNPVTGTLFAVTGKNPLLVELSRQGEILRRIELIGFADPEGVEVLGDGRLAIIDERRRQLTTITLRDHDLSLDAADFPGFDLGFADAGNKGFEAIAWDARSRSLMLGKERGPMGLFSLPFPGEDGAAGVMQPFSYGDLGMRDISSLSIDARTGHALVLSDESRMLLEIDRAGQPVSFLSLSAGRNGLAKSIKQAEGVTMDEEGNIYIVAEPNLFYVFSKEPADAG